jgi:hypothetical protein
LPAPFSSTLLDALAGIERCPWCRRLYSPDNLVPRGVLTEGRDFWPDFTDPGRMFAIDPAAPEGSFTRHTVTDGRYVMATWATEPLDFPNAYREMTERFERLREERMTEAMRAVSASHARFADYVESQFGPMPTFQPLGVFETPDVGPSVRIFDADHGPVMGPAHTTGLRLVGFDGQVRGETATLVFQDEVHSDRPITGSPWTGSVRDDVWDALLAGVARAYHRGRQPWHRPGAGDEINLEELRDALTDGQAQADGYRRAMIFTREGGFRARRRQGR